MYLTIFFFVLFGVLGMEAYSGSFVRRCVWADTLELKIPEEYCKRFDQNDFDKLGRYNPGLHNSCGPLQLCLDVGNLNYGFTHFDNMAGALLTVFQV